MVIQDQFKIEHVDHWVGLRVLCVGDVMLDRFVYGAVQRVSPEAPIPILNIAKENAMPGGVGNVVRNVTALGGYAILIAAIGADHAGTELETMIINDPCVESRIIARADRVTTIKTRYISNGQQLLRTDEETAQKLDQTGERSVIAAINEALPNTHVLVLSDYNKGVLTPAVLRAAIDGAKMRSIPVVVDPKGADFSKYSGAFLIKPNLHELAEATHMSVASHDNVVAAARYLLKTLDFGVVLVTRSEQGMTIVTASQVDNLSARTREVFDVSGAGDTVAATLALSLAAGHDVQLAGGLANVAAGVVVGKTGTAHILPDELRLAIRQNSGLSPIVLDRLGTENRARYWRERGEIVGFTNGCFDLIHPGHVSLLKQARANCDHLIVGLNSDSSVRRLKGEGRPAQAEQARATVLSSLEMVDAVVIFDEDTPHNLIQAIRPDVLVKGADYTIEQVVGSDMVQRWGGRVVLAELEGGHSTSRMISRITAE